MVYDFDIAMSATLSEKVVHEMVIKSVEAQTGKRVTKVVVNYDGTRFDGFQVFFDPETQSKVIPLKSSKEFIVAHFDKN